MKGAAADSIKLHFGQDPYSLSMQTLPHPLSGKPVEDQFSQRRKSPLKKQALLPKKGLLPAVSQQQLSPAKHRRASCDEDCREHLLLTKKTIESRSE